MFAVARKERRRTRTGAAYLALELADASGRVEARRLERRRSARPALRGRRRRACSRPRRALRRKPQVQVRTVETAEDTDPASLTPSMRRDADELDGFFEFLAAEIAHAGLPRSSTRPHATSRSAGRSGRSPLRRRTATTDMPAACSSTPSASPRSAARPRSCIRESVRHRRRGRVAPRRRTDPRARPRPGLSARPTRDAPRARAPRAAHDRGARPRPRPGRPRRACTRLRAITIARRPNRRSSRPLPREPARRKQRRAPSATTDQAGRSAGACRLLRMGVGDSVDWQRGASRSSPCSRSRRQSDSSAFWSGRSSPRPSRRRRLCPQRVAVLPCSGWARSTAASRSARWESSPRSRLRHRSSHLPSMQPAAWFRAGCSGSASSSSAPGS